MVTQYEHMPRKNGRTKRIDEHVFRVITHLLRKIITRTKDDTESYSSQSNSGEKGMSFIFLKQCRILEKLVGQHMHNY